MGTPNMPDSLLEQAAKELHAAVLALSEFVEREYPKRKEVERRFQTKSSSTKRLVGIIVLILVAVSLSYISAIGTVSSCFLGGLKHPEVCQLMPGYQESQTRNEQIILEFRELQKRSLANEQRIIDLENR